MVIARKCYCRSNWAVRNGSSNVAAILNPENHYFLGNNTCYCREKAIKPQLFLRPKKCIFIEDDDESDGLRRRLPRTPRICDQFEYTLPKFKKIAGKEGSATTGLNLASKEISSSYQNGAETQDGGQVFPYEKNKDKLISSSSHKTATSGRVVQGGHIFTKDEDNGVETQDGGQVVPYEKNKDKLSRSSHKTATSGRVIHGGHIFTKDEDNGVETQDGGQVVPYEKNKDKLSRSSHKTATSGRVVHGGHTFTKDEDTIPYNFDKTTDFKKVDKTASSNSITKNEEITSTYDYYKKTFFEDSSSESPSLFRKYFDDTDDFVEHKERVDNSDIVDSVSSKGRHHPSFVSTSEHRTKNIESYGEYDKLSKNHSDLQLKDSKNTQSKLKQLSDFRKDHYFDTHSTEDLIKSLPEHICLHKFELDDRFLPQALNADAYGESRCIICGKVMEKSPVNKVDERFVKNKKLFPKFYKYGLVPKKIYLGEDKNVKLEMVLQGKQLGGWEYKSQKPNYCNTYALRYQKGVV